MTDPLTRSDWQNQPFSCSSSLTGTLECVPWITMHISFSEIFISDFKAVQKLVRRGVCVCVTCTTTVGLLNYADSRDSVSFVSHKVCCRTVRERVMCIIPTIVSDRELNKICARAYICFLLSSNQCRVFIWGNTPTFGNYYSYVCYRE